jgi:hypothetical protein
MLWKNEMVPPRSYPLIAMTAAPSHTITNTISNKRVLSSALVAALNTLQKQGEQGQKEGDLRGENQAEEEGPPQVPVANLTSFLFGLRGHQRVDNDFEFLPNTTQISFLSNRKKISLHTLGSGCLQLSRRLARRGCSWFQTAACPAADSQMRIVLAGTRYYSGMCCQQSLYLLLRRQD